MSRITTKAIVCGFLFAFAILSSVTGGEGEEEVRLAVEKSLPYLQKEGEWWIEKKKCVSCHHTGFLIWSHQLAAKRGFSIDKEKLGGWLDWAVGHQLSRRKDADGNYQAGVVGSSNIEGLAQLILGNGNVRKGPHREAFRKFRDLIRGAQEESDSWKPGGQLPFQKRPAEDTRAVSTMWAVLTLDAFGGDDSRDRGLAYLREKASADPVSTEQAALGSWIAEQFGSEAEREDALKRLLDRQDPEDGGWSWVDGEPSGPMATGQALFALAKAGSDSIDAIIAIGRGSGFLARSQQEDGSWETRSTKAKNKGEATRVSNFFGTSWAVIGLCRALPGTEEPSDG